MNQINLSYRVCIETETCFLHLVVNDAYIQKAIMMDTVHGHGRLIFLFGFNV